MPSLGILGEVDLVLVMTVWPGFGGQKFIEPMLEKIRTIAGQLRPDQRLEVDGGIHSETIAQAARAGADTFVAGSAVFDAADPLAEVHAAAEAGRSGRQRRQGMTRILLIPCGKTFWTEQGRLSGCRGHAAEPARVTRMRRSVPGRLRRPGRRR